MMEAHKARGLRRRQYHSCGQKTHMNDDRGTAGTPHPIAILSEYLFQKGHIIMSSKRWKRVSYIRILSSRQIQSSVRSMTSSVLLLGCRSSSKALSDSAAPVGIGGGAAPAARVFPRCANRASAMALRSRKALAGAKPLCEGFGRQCTNSAFSEMPSDARDCYCGSLHLRTQSNLNE